MLKLNQSIFIPIQTYKDVQISQLENNIFPTNFPIASKTPKCFPNTSPHLMLLQHYL